MRSRSASRPVACVYCVAPSRMARAAASCTSGGAVKSGSPMFRKIIGRSRVRDLARQLRGGLGHLHHVEGLDALGARRRSSWRAPCRVARSASTSAARSCGARPLSTRVHVLVAVGAAEFLGQLDAFVEHHAPGHVEAVLELVGADPHHARARSARSPPACGPAAARSARRARAASRDAAVQQGVVVHRVGLVEAGQVARERVDGRRRRCGPPGAGTAPAARIRARGCGSTWPRPCVRRCWSGPVRDWRGLALVSVVGHDRCRPAGWPSRPRRARRRGPCRSGARRPARGSRW